MKAYLTKRYRFAAAHRLHSDAMSEAENLKTYGKCNNPHGHGHNYMLEVTVSGPVEEKTGMVCKLSDLDQAVRREVLEPFDHMNLNMLEPFREEVPTTENLSMEIFRRLHQSLRAAHLERVRLEETMLNSFEYSGGAEPLR